MQIPFVDLKSQYESIKAEIDDAISKVISKTAFIGGQHLTDFEQAFASFCGVKHCIGVGNGTDAIFIALKALGIGPGDEVITVANSFIATSEAITMAGAKVAFVDIDPKTYNIDTTKLEAYLKKRFSIKPGTRNQKPETLSIKPGTRNQKPETLSSNPSSSSPVTIHSSQCFPKAIIPVHLYGQPADMDPILALAKKYNLKVVEDCAQAHGAVYKGRKIGSIGDAACFSFYPGKNLGAYGDGGAIVMNSDEAAQKARMFANHGRIDKYDHGIEGVNSRLDGLQAAILLAKLKHLPEWTASRRKNAYLYNKYLADTGLVTPVEIPDVTAVYHLYVVRVKKESREKLQAHLNSKGVSTGIHYPIALPNLKAYACMGHSDKDFPEATKASHEIVSLPMFPELTESQIKYISEQINVFSF